MDESVAQKIGSIVVGIGTEMTSWIKPKPDPMVKVFNKAFTVTTVCGVLTTAAFVVDKVLTTLEMNELRKENKSLKNKHD